MCAPCSNCRHHDKSKIEIFVHCYCIILESMSIIQEAPLGQLIYYITKGKVFAYPEDKIGFEIPWEQADLVEKSADLETAPETPDATPSPEKDPLDESSKPAIHSYPTGLSHISTARSVDMRPGIARTSTTSRTLTREQTLPYSPERFDIEQSENLERGNSSVIIPQKTATGVVLVDWYTTDDPANPQNWNSWKKAFVGLQIFLYTFAVYCTSAIYTPSQQGVMQQFGRSYAEGSVGLSIYVAGYGIGPLVGRPWHATRKLQPC